MASKGNNIHDVARRAGVSIATVSHVFNGTKHVSEETRQRVLTAAEGLQYQPNQQARSLRLNHSQLILVLIDEKCLGMNLSLIVSSMIKALQRQSRDVSIHFYHNSEQVNNLLKAVEFRCAYLICLNPFQEQEIDSKANLVTVNFSLEENESLSKSKSSIDMSLFFYRELEKLIAKNNYDHVVANYRQGKALKKNVNINNSAHIHLAASEYSSGVMFMKEMVSNGAERILFIDYTIFAGAVKYLINHEDILYSPNMKVGFLQWNRVPEIYNLPLTIHTISTDEMIKAVLDRMPKE